MSERHYGLLLVGLIVGVLEGVGIGIYMTLDPARPFDLARALVMRGSLFMAGVLGLISALVLTDVVTPGDWLEGVGNDPLSSSILLSALVLGLSWMFCYA
jgi:hypothetical protein